MKIGDYLAEMEIHLIIDGGKRGRFYLLNPEDTSILFIIDVIDVCIYINQNILREYSISEFHTYFSQWFSVSIFPYDDSFSKEDIADLTPSDNIFFSKLMDNITHISISDEGRIVFYSFLDIYISINTYKKLLVYSYTLWLGVLGREGNCALAFMDRIICDFFEFETDIIYA